MHLSEISDAFDKVSRTLLLGKLSQLGVPDIFIDFLNDYLLPREGLVRVASALSESMALADMVFQGTVLGPTLWNAFFGDVASFVPEGNQEINLFADDLTVDTYRPSDMSEEIISDELTEIQQRTHEWGRRNQVQFDPSKEKFRIIHPSLRNEDHFTMLGTLFDCALSMKPCVDHILAKARPKIRALLRIKHMYNTHAMLCQYKIHIWGFSEYSNGVLILASWSQLRRIDKMQRWFLSELGITDQEAFINHNFAPPSMRRRIGLLGFIHKRILEVCHPLICAGLPMDQDSSCRYHSKVLQTFWDDVRGHSRLYERSLFEYILMYNRLPQSLVEATSVKCFQARLTHLAKERAKRDEPNWRQSYENCRDITNFFYG